MHANYEAPPYEAFSSIPPLPVRDQVS